MNQKTELWCKISVESHKNPNIKNAQITLKFLKEDADNKNKVVHLNNLAIYSDV